MDHSSSVKLRRLRSADPDIRRITLTEIDGEVDLVEARDLLPFVRDEDAAIRRLAVQLLGETGENAALPALLDALGDNDPAVSAAAQIAVSEFRTRDTVEIFIAGTKHLHVSARVASVTALGGLRDPQSIPSLKKAAEDPSPSVRSAAMTSLGNLGDASVRHMLHQGLYDEDAAVRRVAVETLARRGGAESTYYLLRTIHDRDWEVRRAVVNTLGRVQDSKVTTALLKALRDPEWPIVKAAVNVLGRQRQPIAGRLKRLLKHPHAEVRLAVMVALQQIEPSERVRPVPPVKDDDRPSLRSAEPAPEPLSEHDLGRQAA